MHTLPLSSGAKEAVLTIKLKRVYDPPSRSDGRRILVDRLWPRGMKKEDAGVNDWLKEIAPSAELRTWFNHDPGKWAQFRKRYFAELERHGDVIQEIMNRGRKGTVTLLFGSKEERYNNAVALKEYLETRMAASGRSKAA